jgi:hypothetical protein
VRAGRADPDLEQVEGADGHPYLPLPADVLAHRLGT